MVTTTSSETQKVIDWIIDRARDEARRGNAGWFSIAPQHCG